MSMSDIFIKRPVLATVVALFMLLLGAMGASNLQIREYPEVDETVVTVTTVYPGASADLIQGFVTSPIAAAVSTAEGVDYVSTQSQPSASVVSVNMRLGADPDVALTEVMSKVQEVRSELPSDAEDPSIVKGTGMQFATMYLALQNPHMTPEQLTEYIERVIRPRMSTIEGVAEVQILGGANYAMRVWIDPVLLASRGLTASEVMQAINSSNFLAAPGKTEGELVSYPITMESTLQTPEAFGAMPLSGSGDSVVRLRDVARVELAAESTDTVVEFNGEPGTFIGIFPTPGANPLDTTANVRAQLPVIQASLPQGMTMTLMYDATDAISASIREVLRTIAEATAIVSVVILLFMGSIRSVAMPVAAIPLSLVGALFLLFVAGYSINLLTLLALVLAIGIVVDDAIVVVENVQRHIDDGMTPMQASFFSMKELFTAIVATTLALMAVFMPLFFTGGLTGALFQEFALALAGAVFLSSIVALTISPMMSARILKAGGHSRFQQWIDRNFLKVEGWYARRVASSFDYRPVTIMIMVVLMGVTAYLFTKTSTELAPEEDAGALLAMVAGPSYATTDYTSRYVDQINDLTAGLPEVEASFSVVGFGGGTNSGFALWALKDWGARDRSQAEVQQDLQARIEPLAGVQAFVFAPPSLPGTGGGLPITMVIQSTSDAAQVYELAEEIKDRAQASGRFIIVQNSMSFDTTQVVVTIDRDRAAALNIPASQIGATLSLLVGGGAIGQFDRDSNSYDVIMQVPREYRENPERLGEFRIRSLTGEMVPLSAVIDINTRAAPASIEQFNQLNAATISALPLPGVTTGDGLAEIEAIAAEILPDGFFIDYSGQSRTEKTEGAGILAAFGLALVVIYLVLAAQFESWRDPFIILTSVPLAIFGVIVPLNLGLGTLNIYTQIAMLALIGIISKHGILLVEFANQQRETRGLSREEGMIEAARLRLRPILMTTIATAVGVVPLMTADGAGAAARFAMGLVIFSGISVGTLFTLFVVPTVYTLIAPKEARPAPEEPDEQARVRVDQQPAQ
ncbi:MAG: efflux RND transporter permease subunit [Paracoccus sp. (in: a-proteobacteria)]|uniref:efflux RND transporter permease subunit n=1 Tax=Paracoccus sp. TaxID=267 RepID=UPI0026E06551|nr:efflux RND transporter permease subunit [Paracoccus sp. (in: a-proteobacteria)]MDO5619947.1 efflux RND transporter permease subunit [Paracoccus sp. (in: a-proteobacteria)]